jgi:TetR/AcrR family transcriptional repressor of nem operon
MGRPAAFDRDEVLQKATNLFWEHGYSATGVADLVEATRLKPGSLYAAFHSKEDLFLAALDHYGHRSVATLQAVLTASASPLEGIRRCFLQISDEVSGDRAGQGCLLVNATLEQGRHGGAIQKRIKAHFNQIEGLFRDALVQARARGELAPDKDPDALAAFLLSSIWGLRVLAGTAPTRKRARAIVKQLLAILA